MRATCMRGLAACLLMLSFFTAAAFAGRNPWEEKDWRKWSSRDCKKVLEESPWVKSDVVWLYDGESQSNQWVRVQFMSALPMRRALARQLMLKKRYDRLDAQQKRAVDDEVQSILAGDSKINVRVQLGGMGFVYDPNSTQTGIILREDSKRMASVGRIPEQGFAKLARGVREYQLIFPREDASSSVIDLNNDAIVVVLPERAYHPRYELVFSNEVPPDVESEIHTIVVGRLMLKFHPRDMIYQGKLEY